MSIPTVIIVGAGAFGVSTALQLKKHRHVHVIVLDRADSLPAMDASTMDINKVVRADYGADALYTRLGLESIDRWKTWNQLHQSLHPGSTPLYHNTGFALFAKKMNAFERDSIHMLQSLGYGHSIELLSDKTARSKLLQHYSCFNDALPHYPEGYFNKTGGWADSGRALEFAIFMAQQAGVEFVYGSEKGNVVGLLGEKGLVKGVETKNGHCYYGDVVVFATGAWTPSLIPELKDCIIATAQPVVHIQVPRSLQTKYASSCVWSADITQSGFYGFPVNDQGILKIGHHGPGFTHFNASTHISTPKTKVDDPYQNIPQMAADSFIQLLRHLFPELANPCFIQSTRLCWYSDSWDGDFYISPVPNYRNLVVASGGSGHGFKFMPILGELIEPVVLEVLIKENKWSLLPGMPSLRPIESRFLFRHPNSNTKKQEGTRMVTTLDRLDLSALASAKL